MAPTTKGTAVAAIGSPDHAAQISARTGSTITATGTGLLAQASGTGAATIDSHGNVTAGNTGLRAVADLAGGTGLASVINQRDGTVTMALTGGPATPYELNATGGSETGRAS